MRTCGNCGSTMLPGGRVQVNGVKTTDSWKCADCGRTAVTLTGCGWIFVVPTTLGFGLMTLALFSRGFRGDTEGMLAGGMMALFVLFLGWMGVARARDAISNPPVE